MKRLLLCVLLVASSFAAQGPVQIDAHRLVSISAVAVYAPDGALASFNVTAKFTVAHLNPGGAITTRVVNITFDLVEAGRQSVLVGNTVVDYDKIAAQLVAACVAEYDIAHPGPLPGPVVERRALRAQPP